MISPSNYYITEYEETYNPNNCNVGDAVRFDTTVVRNHAWSPIIFNGRRTADNFLNSSVAVIDIDENLPIEKARERLAEFGLAYFIGLTKSHKKEKNGKVEDRFRIVLFLDKPITDSGRYRHLLQQTTLLFPESDQAAQLASQFFFPCDEEWFELNLTGDPFKYNDTLGLLSRNTMKFFQNQTPKGQRHSALFKATIDMIEQGYKHSSIDYVMNNLDPAYSDPKARKTIEWCYKHGGKYGKRKDDAWDDFNNKAESKSVKIISGSDLVSQPIKEREHVVTDMLTLGQLSLVVGNPGSGKTLLARDLATSVSLGESWLGFPTEKNKTLMVLLEENIDELKRYLQHVKTDVSKIDFVFEMESLNNPIEKIKLLKSMIEEKRSELVIIDTLGSFMEIKDLNNYSEVNAIMDELNSVARRLNVHIMLLHHARKQNNYDDVVDWGNVSLGSQAILGKPDYCMGVIHNTKSGYRKIATIKNRYGTAFKEHFLVLDNDNGRLRMQHTNCKYEIIKNKILSVIAQNGEPMDGNKLKIMVPWENMLVGKMLHELKIAKKVVVMGGTGKKGDPFKYGIYIDKQETLWENF